MIASEPYVWNGIPFAMFLDSTGKAIRAFPIGHHDREIVRKSKLEKSRVRAVEEYNKR